MAKDDYDTIVFKILLYLYAVLKRKITFDEQAFYHAIGFKNIDNDYFINILYMMHEDGLIDGIVLKKAWGNTYILCSDLIDMTITSNGIHYLNDNKKMNKIKEYLLSNVDTIASLINLCI